MSDRTVVLTGGTAGIGAALARRLRDSGDRVVIVGRRQTNVAHSVAVDLRASNACEIVQNGLRRLGASDWNMLIHNAGIGWVGAFPEQSPVSIVDILRVNVWSPIALTHQLVRSASPDAARVVFVSSPIAHWPSPDYAVYAASKAAIEAFARALRAERVGVAVQVIRPAATQSEMLTEEDAGRLLVDPGRFKSPEATAVRMLKLLAGNPHWRGTDVASSLAEPLRRWLGGMLISRRPRIEWPVSLLNDPPETRTPAALVTGAAEGIGRALAIRFAAAGHTVVGVDRNAEGLGETVGLVERRGGTASAVVADLSNLPSFDRLASELEARGPFDAVIHNAGINRFGRFVESDPAEQERIFAVNLVAPILLTRELFARRLINSDARLGFVSSLSHFVGYPGAAVYASTKSGLVAFAEALRWAGKKYGFSTTTIFPGPTRTRQAIENSPDNRREHRRTDPAVLADAIFQAMDERKAILVHGTANRFAAELGRRFPRLTESMMRRALLGGITSSRRATE
jgi:cyclic-di-GMP-binding biofilm dispersal mediator protein